MNLKKLMYRVRKIWVNILGKFGLIEDPNIYYINGTQKLPEPLKKEEEALLINKLDSDERDEVKSELISRNLRLVVYLAKKFENTKINFEDLVSIGNIGLIKAVNTFKADKNIKLATYASRCIENEILMFIRKNNRKRNELSIDEPLNVDWDGNELLLVDVLSVGEKEIYKDIEHEVDVKILRKCMDKLSNREKAIIELRYGIYSENDELTQKEVADQLGISQSYISRLEKKIIRKLKKEMSKMY